jgi:hypothetical protein
MHFYTYAHKYPSSTYDGNQINPLSHHITRSPCDNHPVLGGPCIYSKKSKERPECENCHWIGMGDCKDPRSFEHIKIAPYASRKNVYQECRWTGCTETTKGNHCKKHASHYSNRMKRWKELYGDKKPDPKFIYRDIEPIGGRKPIK